MDAINWHSCFFLLFAAIACAFAVAVVMTGNIVRMAAYLVVSLGAVAGLFFLAGADFLGAAQLMVYVGGTMVLLVFGVMLTARGPFVSMKTGGGQWILATLVSIALLAILLQMALSVGNWSGEKKAQVAAQSVVDPTSARLGMGLLGVRVDQLENPDPVTRRGMSGYLLVFEIISIHLLVVLIGAAYLARAKRRVE
jgi:NADH-quinone oxidoreductase subunit J